MIHGSSSVGKERTRVWRRFSGDPLSPNVDRTDHLNFGTLSGEAKATAEAMSADAAVGIMASGKGKDGEALIDVWDPMRLHGVYDEDMN